MEIETSVCWLFWLQEEPDTTVEPLFCGQLELAHPKCILHQLRPIKRVAFEGPVTGRRFYGCPVQVRCQLSFLLWMFSDV